MNTIDQEFRKAGYKVFDKHLQCRGFQYEIGKTFEHAGPIQICNSGFHLCDHLIDCFNYYEWSPENRVCVVNYDSRTLLTVMQFFDLQQRRRFGTFRQQWRQDNEHERKRLEDK